MSNFAMRGKKRTAMFSLNPMKDLYESPLAPMALTDYEAFS